MTCAKTRYRDRIAAQMALLKAQRSNSPRRREGHPYPCPLCRAWHLTSQQKRSAA